MIKKMLIGLVFSLLIGLPVAGQSKVEQVVFDQANQLYLNGEYSSAREEYLKNRQDLFQVIIDSTIASV